MLEFVTKRKWIVLPLILAAIFLGLLLYKILHTPKVETQIAAPPAKLTPGPFVYQNPKLPKKKRYDIYLVGDSMTHAFGPRGGVFNEILSKAYPAKFFEISNYAQANQSILLLPIRLNEPVQASPDLLLKPMLEGKPAPDLIIIESYGYNPLSQFGEEAGLAKQEQLLSEIMNTLTNRYPDTIIMFLTAIGPDKKTYGEKITHAPASERWAQAEERIEYITNHRDYAIEHGIPLIDVYKESLDETGDGDVIYINPDDNIHPSAEGLALMGRIMTKRIREEKIFP